MAHGGAAREANGHTSSRRRRRSHHRQGRRATPIARRAAAGAPPSTAGGAGQRRPGHQAGPARSRRDRRAPRSAPSATATRPPRREQRRSAEAVIAVVWDAELRRPSSFRWRRRTFRMERVVRTWVLRSGWWSEETEVSRHYWRVRAEGPALRSLVRPYHQGLAARARAQLSGAGAGRAAAARSRCRRLAPQRRLESAGSGAVISCAWRGMAGCGRTGSTRFRAEQPRQEAAWTACCATPTRADRVIGRVARVGGPLVAPDHQRRRAGLHARVLLPGLRDVAERTRRLLEG